MKRVAHVLWRSRGGMRRHVRSIARHPPHGWETAGVWGPGELASYFNDVPFHAVSGPGLLTAGRGADVVHAHGLTAGAAALVPFRAPVVVTLHVVTGGSGRTKRSRVARLAAKIIASRADAVVAASELAAEGFARARVIAPAFEPLPLPERDREMIREQLGTASDDVVVVTVSRLEEGKRLEVFAQAVERSGAVGWIVGDGMDRERVAAAASDTGAQLLGYRDDVADILAAADVFALPSASESYGIAIAEAIEAGLPVVATRTGAVEELVGEGGILVAADDTEGFSAAVATLVRDPAERSHRAEAARRTKRPDMKVLIAELGTVYDEVSR